MLRFSKLNFGGSVMSLNNVSVFDVNRCESRHGRSRFGVSNCNEEDMDLDQEMFSEPAFEGIVGQSAALRQVLDLVETVAPSDSTVLLLGETGTGKELVARAIHQLSRRRQRGTSSFPVPVSQKKK